MQLTKFTHSCVRFDDGDRSLVIDPGVFSERAAALDGADAVLITHEHADHVVIDELAAGLERDSRLQVWAPESVAGRLSRFGEQVTVVDAGESFTAAGFDVQTFGHTHAMVHPLIPVVANVGYLIAGVFHPGDSFTVPSAPVSTLLLPTNAPWSKGQEVIDYAIAVRASRVHQIHDSLVTDVYAGMIEGHLGRVVGPYGVEFEHLAPATTVTI